MLSSLIKTSFLKTSVYNLLCQSPVSTHLSLQEESLMVNHPVMCGVSSDIEPHGESLLP